MIKVVMTKTSENYWYQIRVIPNLEALMVVSKQPFFFS